VTGGPASIVDIGVEENALLLFIPETQLGHPRQIAAAAQTPLPRRAPRRPWAQMIVGFAGGIAIGVSGIVVVHTAPQKYAAALPAAPGLSGPTLIPVAAPPLVDDPVSVAETAGVIAASSRSASPPGPAQRSRNPPFDAGVPSIAAHLGTLRVESQPTGARVFVNNEYVGETPLVVGPVPAGSRAVRVQLDGYEPWSRGVRIVANESTIVAAQLTVHP